MKNSPPKNAKCCDQWYNSDTQHVYMFSEPNEWIATDFEDHVIDVITVDPSETSDTPTDAYDRAMKLL